MKKSMPFSCQNPYISWVFTHFSPVFHLHKKKKRYCNFFFDDGRVAGFVEAITHHALEMVGEVAGAEGFFNAPGDVAADGFGFRLCEGSMKTKKKFCRKRKRVEVFFFKDYCDAKEFQLTDVCEAVDGVTGKTRDAFAEDYVDFAAAAKSHEPVELFSFGSLCAA